MRLLRSSRTGTPHVSGIAGTASVPVRRVHTLTGTFTGCLTTHGGVQPGSFPRVLGLARQTRHLRHGSKGQAEIHGAPSPAQCCDRAPRSDPCREKKKTCGLVRLLLHKAPLVGGLFNDPRPGVAAASLEREKLPPPQCAFDLSMYLIILRFTYRHAFSCGLHRPTSRVIPH